MTPTKVAISIQLFRLVFSLETFIRGGLVRLLGAIVSSLSRLVSNNLVCLLGFIVSRHNFLHSVYVSNIYNFIYRVYVTRPIWLSLMTTLCPPGT